MTALLLSYIWLWQGAFPGHFAVCVGLYAGLGLSAHLRRGERLVDVGFGLRDFARAAYLAVLCVGPLVLLAVAVGFWLESFRTASVALWPTHIVGRVTWGTVQQYGLLGVYLLRLRELLAGDRQARLAAASVFALFHLPNPFLTGVTFVAGWISCWIYSRARNLWALGLAHGALSIALSRCLPPELTVGMRVGPGFWRFLAELEATPLVPWWP